VHKSRAAKRAIKLRSADEQVPTGEFARFVLAKSLTIAAEVDGDPHVEAFRREHLGGRLLDDDAAVDEWIQARRSQGLVSTVEVYVDVSWQPTEPIVQTGPDHIGRQGVHGILEYASDGAVGAVIVGRGSVLGELLTISDYLVRRTGWQRAQATTHVLTGATPNYSMCRLTMPAVPHGDPARVTITVDVDTPAEEVLRAYSKAQQHLRGKRTRRPMPRALELVILAGENPDMSDYGLMAQWNRTRPGDAFTDIRSFRQALRDGRRRVLGAPRPRR
jgi:hypothetical protein